MNCLFFHVLDADDDQREENAVLDDVHHLEDVEIRVVRRLAVDHSLDASQENEEEDKDFENEDEQHQLEEAADLANEIHDEAVAAAPLHNAMARRLAEHRRVALHVVDDQLNALGRQPCQTEERGDDHTFVQFQQTFTQQIQRFYVSPQQVVHNPVIPTGDDFSSQFLFRLHLHSKRLQLQLVVMH